MFNLELESTVGVEGGKGQFFLIYLFDCFKIVLEVFRRLLGPSTPSGVKYCNWRVRWKASLVVNLLKYSNNL